MSVYCYYYFSTTFARRATNARVPACVATQHTRIKAILDNNDNENDIAFVAASTCAAQWTQRASAACSQKRAIVVVVVNRYDTRSATTVGTTCSSVVGTTCSSNAQKSTIGAVDASFPSTNFAA